MDDKEYFEKLKEEDYIAWDSCINDPIIQGSSSRDGCFSPLVFIVFVIVSLLIIFISN